MHSLLLPLFIMYRYATTSRLYVCSQVVPDVIRPVAARYTPGMNSNSRYPLIYAQRLREHAFERLIQRLAHFIRFLARGTLHYGLISYVYL